MSYANGTGCTLTLPSPNSVHRVDVAAAVRSIRRSLSRSPSKFSLSRAYSQSTETPNPIPGSPSPCHIITRSMPPASAPHLTQQHSQTSLSTPYRPGVKLSLRSGKPKAASAKPLFRAPRVPPRSPVRRALSHTTVSGNSIASPSAASTTVGQENDVNYDCSLNTGPTTRNLDISRASNNTVPRFFDFKADTLPATSVSPLKRSDAYMSPDSNVIDCPFVKRRSLHGIPGASIIDGNIFDAPCPPTGGFEIHVDPSQDCEPGSSPSSLPDNLTSPTPTAMPRRTDSLRRSTLQQRQSEKLSWGRRQGEKQLAQIGTETASPNLRTPDVKARPRASLDQFVHPALPRDSPFSAQPPLPNPSLHVLDRPINQAQPHPLRRSVTTTSSNSSLADDSPTHVPTQFERPRPIPHLARSMPLNARPIFGNANINATTPAYKNAKPLQDAFKSTGLISKVNRHPELEPPPLGGPKAIMPDTPCKKPIYPSNTYPPSSGRGKRGHRHSFGSPSSPFALDRKDGFGGESNNVSSLCRPFQPSLTRKPSLSHLDPEIDADNLPDNNEFPPTPTKSVFFKSLNDSMSAGESPFATTSTPATMAAAGFRDFGHHFDNRCNVACFEELSTHKNHAQQDNPCKAATPNVVLGKASSPAFSESHLSLSGFGGGRDSCVGPERLKVHATTPALPRQKPMDFAKTDLVVTASPPGHMGKFSSRSPKTPIETNTPLLLDPGSLSILNNQEGVRAPSIGSFPPATPTSRQEGLFGGFVDRRMSITPVNGQGSSDMEMVLKSRFAKVELIGKGEFSQVFKVIQAGSAMTDSPQGGTPGTPPTPSQARVFAVKKSSMSTFIAKDRDAKFREVKVLKALRGCPHVLQYVDSWEKQYHLYIQTEYCEEGSLSNFLKTVGASGRLDDFRIWKILLEACMGLQNIHDAGFIHLDFKPENVLITYEGQLKIGDFGLATEWPAAIGVEGEGDRRYIALEVLHGQYDKPADVFALGLVMLEIASNAWLPHNGPYWQALRHGDFSAVPAGLLTGLESDALVRDATGMPITGELAILSGASPLPDEVGKGTRSGNRRQGLSFNFTRSPTHDASNLFGALKRSALHHPPAFMVQADNPVSLDRIVQWMLAPKPDRRPTVQQIMELDSMRWITVHRRAGAIVYEGNWGPQDGGGIGSDTEMMDV